VKRTHRAWSSAIVLAVVTAGWAASAQSSGSLPPDPAHIPTLTTTCLITRHVRRLVDFYEPILAIKAKWSGGDYAEFSTGAGVLAIFSEEAQERYIPGSTHTSGSTKAATNRSMVLEFRVADVDQQYRRLQSAVKTWVKPPTTQPWGTRSIYFRDPDGNLVDFYTPPKVR
jgi:catechol 2,3-dioxygenase-like lactoylglutathione lyase family enzyme